MNRTRLAQLTAVLGAAVLLVLAVSVTRTGPSTVRPALDQIATQAPAASGSPTAPGGQAPEAADGTGDTPVVGPTATDTTSPGPGDEGIGQAAPAPAESAGETTPTPSASPSTGSGPLPPAEPQGPFPQSTADGTASPSASATPSPQPTASPSGTPAPAPPAPTAPEPDPGAATASPSPEARPEVQAPHDRVHEVVRGDTLWDIAEAALGPRPDDAEVAVAVTQLYELNREVIGTDPDLIFPGQVLHLPQW